jgi:hypothetical protein
MDQKEERDPVGPVVWTEATTHSRSAMVLRSAMQDKAVGVTAGSESQFAPGPTVGEHMAKYQSLPSIASTPSVVSGSSSPSPTGSPIPTPAVHLSQTRMIAPTLESVFAKALFSSSDHLEATPGAF